MTSTDRPYSNEEIDALRSRIAEGNGLTLYKRYTEEEAADFLGVHPQTLKKKRLAGQIDCIKVSARKISYFGFHIADHLIENITCRTNRNQVIKSGTIGSLNARIEKDGIEPGTTRKVATLDARASLAARALKMPSER